MSLTAEQQLHIEEKRKKALEKLQGRSTVELPIVDGAPTAVHPCPRKKPTIPAACDRLLTPKPVEPVSETKLLAQ